MAYRRALELGYDKVVVVLTRPMGYRKQPQQRAATRRLLDRTYRRYPALCRALRESPRRYNAEYAELERLEREGRIFVLRPDGPVLVGRLERDVAKLEALYQAGRRVILDQLDDMMRYLHG